MLVVDSLNATQTPPWEKPRALTCRFLQISLIPDPRARCSRSSCKESPSVNQVSVTIATEASISLKQSMKELILGQRERAFVLITVNGSNLLALASSFVTFKEMPSLCPLSEFPEPDLSYVSSNILPKSSEETSSVEARPSFPLSSAAWAGLTFLQMPLPSGSVQKSRTKSWCSSSNFTFLLMAGYFLFLSLIHI